MKETYIEKTVDLKFSELCEEIDFLKAETKYWKDMYEEINKKYMNLLGSNIKHNEAIMGNILKLCLSMDVKKAKKQFANKE